MAIDSFSGCLSSWQFLQQLISSEKVKTQRNSILDEIIIPFIFEYLNI